MGSLPLPARSPLFEALELSLGFLGDLRSRHAETGGDLHDGQKARRVLTGLVPAVLRTVQAGLVGRVLLTKAKPLAHRAQDVADDSVFGLR